MAKRKSARGKTARRGGRQASLAAGVATGIAAAVVGGYLLYKNTEPQRTQAKAWILKSRKEAARNVKKLRKVGAAEYARIVDKAVKHYGALYKANAPELAKAAADMRAEWKHIQAEARKAGAGAPRRRARRASARRKTKRS